MADSPRWCATCEAHGDHHTDRHPVEPMAVLFSYDPETGEHSVDPLVGLHSSGDDPVTWALGLKASIEDDFPGRLWAITANDEARALRGDRLVEKLTGEKPER